MLTKTQKAHKVIDHLPYSVTKTAEFCTKPVGEIHFFFKEINQTIAIPSHLNIYDSFRLVARELTRLGHYVEDLKKILQFEDEEKKRESESRKEFLTTASVLIESHRVSLLSIEEKIEDIKQKYGIQIIDYTLMPTPSKHPNQHY